MVVLLVSSCSIINTEDRKFIRKKNEWFSVDKSGVAAALCFGTILTWYQLANGA